MSFIPASKRDTATFLYQLAGIISHRAFASLLQSTTNRFNREAPFMGDVILGLNQDAIKSLGDVGDRSISELRALREGDQGALANANRTLAAATLIQIADTLSSTESKSILASAKKFTVPRGADFLETANNFFGHDLAETMRLTINAYQNPSSEAYVPGINFSYVTDVIYGVSSYIRARLTLLTNTGHNGFESVLMFALGKGRDYWLRGYPKDLLVHDLNLILSGCPLSTIAFKESILSTYTTTSNGLECTSDEYRWHISLMSGQQLKAA